MTPNNFAQNYSIDKVRRWKPHDISELGNQYKFITLALTTCDLNGLANRGYLKTEMNMKSELGPICSIYRELCFWDGFAGIYLKWNYLFLVGAELANKSIERLQGPVHFDIQISVNQSINDNSKLLSTYTPYRVLISR